MSKFRVVVSHPVPTSSIDILRDSCDIIFPSNDNELFSELKRAHASLVFGRSVKYDEMLLQKIEGTPLKIVANMGTGMDHMDVAALKRRGIIATNTAGISDNSVAELAVTLALGIGLRIKERYEAIKNGEWDKYPEWLCGQDICGSTFGIIGLGGIGRAIAKRIHGFDPSRILYSGNAPKEYAKEFNAEFVSLHTLLELSDFVVIACPLNNETTQMINAEKLKLMKKSAVIVNIARGEIIDQEALVSALQDGTIAGAALDVMMPEPLPPNHILVSLKNCLLSPHQGSATYATRFRMVNRAAVNVFNALHGKPVLDLVDA